MTEASRVSAQRTWPLRHKLFALLASILVSASLLAAYLMIYAELRARTRAFCERRQMPVLDLAQHPSFRDAEEELFYDTVHLNEEGHRRVASVVAERLEGMLGD